MLKNKCCLYVIISIRFFSITICNSLIEFPSYMKTQRVSRRDSAVVLVLWFWYYWWQGIVFSDT